MEWLGKNKAIVALILTLLYWAPELTGIQPSSITSNSGLFMAIVLLLSVTVLLPMEFGIMLLRDLLIQNRGGYDFLARPQHILFVLAGLLLSYGYYYLLASLLVLWRRKSRGAAVLKTEKGGEKHDGRRIRAAAQAGKGVAGSGRKKNREAVPV